MKICQTALKGAEVNDRARGVDAARERTMHLFGRARQFGYRVFAVGEIGEARQWHDMCCSTSFGQPASIVSAPRDSVEPENRSSRTKGRRRRRFWWICARTPNKNDRRVAMKTLAKKWRGYTDFCVALRNVAVGWRGTVKPWSPPWE